MKITQRFFLLTIGLFIIFFILGCEFDEGDPIQPTDTSGGEVIKETMNSAEIEASFEQTLMPILSARCAYAGCHVAGGPHNLDFSTYQAFIRGGEDGAVFRPGNAQDSDVIEEIVSGRMPPGGPRLPDEEIQLFRDWINQQDPADFPNLRYDDDDDDDDHNDHDHD